MALPYPPKVALDRVLRADPKLSAEGRAAVLREMERLQAECERRYSRGYQAGRRREREELMRLTSPRRVEGEGGAA